MASDNTMRLRAVSSKEEKFKAQWREKNRELGAMPGGTGAKRKLNKRTGLRTKATGSSPRRALRKFLKMLPRSIRRRDGAAIELARKLGP